MKKGLSIMLAMMILFSMMPGFGMQSRVSAASTQDYAASVTIPNGSADYYRYIQEKMVPTYGICDTSVKSKYCTTLSIDWEKRRGILSADYADYNGDKVQDMMVICIENNAKIVGHFLSRDSKGNVIEISATDLGLSLAAGDRETLVVDRVKTRNGYALFLNSNLPVGYFVSGGLNYTYIKLYNSSTGQFDVNYNIGCATSRDANGGKPYFCSGPNGTTWFATEGEAMACLKDVLLNAGVKPSSDQFKHYDPYFQEVQPFFYYSHLDENGTGSRGLTFYARIQEFTGATQILEAMLPPVITKQPEDVRVKDGESTLFSIEASGNNLKYQWYYRMPGADSFVKWSGRTAAGFSFEPTASKSGMQLYCEITDEFGNKIVSDTVTLTVEKELKIVTQPANVTVNEGENASFRVSASGDGLTYQWYYKLSGASGFTKWTGKTSAAVSLSASASKNDMQVYCVVTDTYGKSVTSNTALLTVKKELTITRQPVNVTVNAGENASFSVSASGTGLTYQWYYQFLGASGFTKWTGKTASTVSVSASASKNGMKVYCVVTDASGKSVNSNIVTMTVKTALSITRQPVDVTVNEGEKASFSVSASGSGLTYQWYYKLSGASGFTKWDGKTASSFSYTPSASKNGMQIYCLVKDENGKSVSSNTATLTVKTALAITRQPSDVTVYEGEKASFSVSASGSSLTYQWYYKLSGASGFTKWDGKTAASFNYTPSAAKNGMQVYCIVRDADGKTVNSNTATLTVKKVLAITKQPVNVTVNEGEKASFSVSASGSGLTYQWYYKLTGSAGFTKWDGKTASAFNYTPSAAKNGMQVYCIVRDADGKSVTSNTVTLTVKAGLAITLQPDDQIVCIGDTATFRVAVTGNGLTYQWYRRTRSTASFTLVSGATGASIQIQTTSSMNGYQYYCVIKDADGNQLTSRTATLSVKEPVRIMQQPQSQNVQDSQNRNVTFSLSAVGEELTYQWYVKYPSSSSFSKWGSGGEKDSLTVEASNKTNGCQFYCIVTDRFGKTAQSDTVSLTYKFVIAI